jgi:hypothetical protein
VDKEVNKRPLQSVAFSKNESVRYVLSVDKEDFNKVLSHDVLSDQLCVTETLIFIQLQHKTPFKIK